MRWGLEEGREWMTGLEELNQIPTFDLFCKIPLRNVSFLSLRVDFINIYEQLLLVQTPKHK
jgi:hypothetical protein